MANKRSRLHHFLVFGGRGEIDRVAGEIRATHIDFRYQPIAEPEETGNGGRVRWAEGRRGEAPAYAGSDFIIASDGRIAALYFSTNYPELSSAVFSHTDNELAKPRNLLIISHRVPRDEIRHVPSQRVADDAGSAEMDAAKDASVSDF